MVQRAAPALGGRRAADPVQRHLGEVALGGLAQAAVQLVEELDGLRPHPRGGHEGVGQLGVHEREAAEEVRGAGAHHEGREIVERALVAPAPVGPELLQEGLVAGRDLVEVPGLQEDGVDVQGAGGSPTST
jgi:hypothetical protein